MPHYQAKRPITPIILLVLTMAFSPLFQDLKAQNSNNSNWEAPDWADTLTNPMEPKKAVVKKGKVLFTAICKTCHGPEGHGNGPQAESLSKQPANLPSAAVQQQSDGALFWKISEGNSPMLSFRNSLSKKQRWQVVNYIRKLGEKYGDKTTAKKSEDKAEKAPDKAEAESSSAEASSKSKSADAKAKAETSQESSGKSTSSDQAETDGAEASSSNATETSKESEGKASTSSSSSDDDQQAEASGSTSESSSGNKDVSATAASANTSDVETQTKNTVMGVSLGFLLFSGMIAILVAFLGLGIAFLNVMK